MIARSLAVFAMGAAVLTTGGVRVHSFANSGTVLQSAVWGNTVFWTKTSPRPQGGAVPESLFEARLDHYSPHKRFTFSSGATVQALQASQDWLLAQVTGGRGSSVWAMNRTTDRARTVAFRANSSNAAVESVSLSQDTAAFETLTRVGGHGTGAETQWKLALHAVTLPKRDPRVFLSRLTACPQGMEAPSLSTTLWVGALRKGCSNQMDVYGYDPVQRRLTMLTSNHDSGDAVTNGQYAAWIQYKPGHLTQPLTGRVVLLNLATRVRRVISGAPPGLARGCRAGSGGTQDKCVSDLGMTADIVYWLNGRALPEAYDLNTCHSYMVPANHLPELNGFGSGSGRRWPWSSQVLQPRPGHPRSWLVVARVP